MSVLTIENFSCLRFAKFETANINILIGPQGSGKSVTTKLNYFFTDIMIRQYQCAETGLDLEDFKRDCARQFRLWFPPGAWGSGRFNINFSAGPFTVRILRRMSKGTVADDVSISLSDFFSKQYREIVAAFEEIRSSAIDEDTGAFRRSIESSFKIRERFESLSLRAMGSEFRSSQIFIPAGRSFFTSIGKLFAAFEQGSSLDPVTLRFAKLFAGLRENYFRMTPFRGSKDSFSERRRVMRELFGGEIKFENDFEFVETKDKRKVPFSALSSGQQELLPMWLLVDFFAERGSERRGGDIFYIEEPEAHLFPAAQSMLLDFLIGALASKAEKRNLILTTHSPYILGKINNYLKAGMLGKQKRMSSLVEGVIPKELWLQPDQIRVYAIEDGHLRDLIDDEGLISVSYIDEVSEEVSDTFNKLLDIQYPETKI